MNQRRILFLLGLAISVAGCVTAPVSDQPVDTEAVAPAVVADPPAEDALARTEIELAVARYADGVEVLQQGNTDAAMLAMSNALAQLDALADQCADSADCDASWLVVAYQEVLALEHSLYQSSDPSLDEDSAIVDASDASADPDEDQPVVAVALQLESIIPLHEKIEKSLFDWLTWNRPLLIQTWHNYAHMRDLMWPGYREAGLPEALLFGILAVESGGKVHAWSRAGAAGPLQFMPATARRYGLDVGGKLDERFEAQAAARASARYLVDQYQRLDNSLEKTLAAYNGGENRVRRLHQRNPDADFWDREFFFNLPADTRKYVPDVLAAAWLFDHSQEFGLTWPVRDYEIKTVTLEREASLNELSVCLGNSNLARGWFRALRNLNPGYRSDQIIPVGGQVRLPAAALGPFQSGCGDPELVALAQRLRLSAQAAEPESVAYRIRPGDSLSRIASRLKCATVTELAALNNIKPPRYLIRVGKTIQVPNC